MSYVNKKIRVFKEAGDIEVQRKRSDGRMKTYLSATDARAWCDSTEQRRQHILDLVRQGDGKGLSLGKYIPIEAIIDILLTNKNEDIRRLQNEIEELKKLLKSHGIAYEEKTLKVVDPTKSDGGLGAGAPKTSDFGVKGKGGDFEDKHAFETDAGEEKPRGVRKKRSLDDSESPESSEETPLTGESSDDENKKASPAYGKEDGKASPRYGKEDEKAAAALLAGKSPEDQLLALKEALAETESTYNWQRDLAVEAIEQLEAIKDIVDGVEGQKERSRRPSSAKATDTGRSRRLSGVTESCKEEIEVLEREIETMKLSSSPESAIVKREVQVLKQYCAQLGALQKENSDLKNERDMLKDGLQSTADGALKDKLNKLDEVTQERDRLKTRVQQLEGQLAGTPSLGADDKDLRKRLDQLAGLEDEVRRLRKKADECVQPAGDSNDRDKLLAKIAELERELDNCNCKLRELEMLKVERNCLKMRLDDLGRIQDSYEDLLKKTQGFEAQKAECAMYKAKYDELKTMEAECNELRAKVQKVEALENERQLLVKEIEDCECCMSSQENEIKRLACHIECLSQDLDKRQSGESDQMKTKVLTMRSHIEKKDCIIAKSEQQLANVQEQLRTSIEQLSCETTCLRNRIEELELEVAQKDKALTKRDEQCSALEITLKMLETGNKELLQKLDAEKNNKVKLEDALKKSIKSDEHLKLMLKEAKRAIKCISQKLAKHELIGVGRLEAEQENYLRKMKEMEEKIGEQPTGLDRIAELEQELMKANAANKTLRDNLDQLKGILEENESLRRVAGELQDAAKNQVAHLEDTNENLSKKSQETEEQCADLKQRIVEKDQMIAELRKQVVDLQKKLEHSEQLQKETANALTSSPSGEIDSSELGKLRAQMNVLNAENDRLNFDLANQKKECEDTVKKLRAKMEQMERDAETIKKLEEQSLDANTDVSRFRKESELLQGEVEKLRAALKAKEAQCEAEISKLKQELASLASLDADNKMLQDEVKKLKEILQDTGNKSKDEAATKGTLESENKNLNDELSALKKDMAAKTNIENENKSLKDTLQQLQQDLSSLAAVEKENKTLKDELAKLKQECASKGDTEKDNKNLKDEINKLKQELVSKGDAAKDCKDLQDEVLKLKQELGTKDGVDKDNKNLKDEIGKLKQEASSAKQEASSAQQELAKAKQDLAALKQELDKLNKELSSLQKDASGKGNVEDENKNLKDELDKLKKQLTAQTPTDDKDNRFAKERDDLLQQIAAQKKEIADLVEKIKTPAKSEDATPLRELENKNKENNQLKSTIDDLEKKLKELEKAKMQVPEGSPEIEKTVNELRNSLEKEEKKAADLEDKMRKCQEKNEALKKQIAELEGKDRGKPMEQVVKKEVEPEKIPKAGGDRVKQLEAELAKQKKECNDMIASLKDQYDRDIRNIQKQNEAAIDKLQKAHRDALNQLNEEHERDGLKLKQELRASVTSKEPAREDLKPVKEEVKPPEPEKTEKSPAKNYDVCICGKLPEVIPLVPVASQRQKPATEPCRAPCSYPEQPPPCAPQPPCANMRMRMLTPAPLSLFQNEKVNSIKKIAELESKLLNKQQYTKQKIDTLQSTVDKFKKELELERQRNSDLVSRYTNQSKTVNNMQVEIDLWKRENVEHKKTLQQLNTKLRTIAQVGGSPVIYPCTPCSLPANSYRRSSGITHFHTELVKDGDNKYKQNCIVKRTPCPCNVSGDSDSYEIDE